jgi:hypothetical protein
LAAAPTASAVPVLDARSRLERLSALRGWNAFWTVIFPIFGLIAAYWLVAGPILGSPYWGDDHGDSQLPMRLAASQTSFFRWWIDLTQEWSATTGRFFPLNVLHAGAVFYFFNDRAIYKLYQFVILAISLSGFAFLIGTILRSRWAGYAAFGLALMTIQMRSWYDPFWEFGGQQPLVNLLSCLGLATAIVACRQSTRRGATIATIIGMVIFAGAILTYESSIFLVVAVPILLLRERESLKRRVAIVAGYGAVSLVLLINLLWQRSLAVVTNPGYQVALDPHLVARTLRNQMGGAIPLSYRVQTVNAVLPSDAGWPTDRVLTVFICALFAGVMTVALLNVFRLPRRGLVLAGIAALIYWVIPSFFVAISARWQMEVRPGVAYIPVMAGGLAVAWLLVLAASALGRALRSPGSIAAPWSGSTRGLTLVAACLAIGVGTIAGITASSNATAVRDPAIVVQQLRRDAYIDALQNGLYKGIAANSFIGHNVGEWWNWENSAFGAWYGASPDLQFVLPQDFPNANCTVNECYILVEQNPAPGVITYDLERVTGS